MDTNASHTSHTPTSVLWGGGSLKAKLSRPKKALSSGSRQSVAVGKLHRAFNSRGHPVGINAESGVAPMTVSQPPCNRWAGLAGLWFITEPVLAEHESLSRAPPCPMPLGSQSLTGPFMAVRLSRVWRVAMKTLTSQGNVGDRRS